MPTHPSRPPPLLVPYFHLCVSECLLCTAAAFLFESGGHSRWMFLRPSVSNAELIYLCVHVHVCMIVLGGSGTLLPN